MVSVHPKTSFHEMHTTPAAQRWSIVLCTVNWIFWSNLTILFNKWILESTPFRYPILLTSWHLFFATLATQLLFRTSILAKPKSIRMTPTLYMAKIAPIGLLYSGSLVCSNTAYMYLNVGFIQMLKASGPVITLLTSALYGVTDLTPSKLVNVAVITASVGLTVTSEIRFSWVGVAVQFVSLVCDALRLVLMQVLTSSASASKEEARGVDGDKETGALDTDTLHETIPHDEEQSASTSRNANQEKRQSMRLNNMDPLLSLYYTAPICAVMNGILAWRAEILPLLQSQPQTNSTSPSPPELPAGLLGMILSTGLGTLLLNAVVGFMLNVAVFTLVGKTSGLTMTLVSIPKNILLILASVILWRTSVSLLQAAGYAGALGGLVVYAGGGGYIRRLLRGSVAWARWKGMARYGYWYKYEGSGLDTDGGGGENDRVKPG
ncbi:triose-phosphate transporter family-domain-containing protein [Aspergillus fruticulosus]